MAAPRHSSQRDKERAKKFLYISLGAHFALLLIFIISFDFAGPHYVFENTNKTDVISAVVLADSVKSKILPHEVKPKIEPKPEPTPQPEKAAPPAPVKKDEIALEVKKKKEELAKQKAEVEKKQHDLLAKSLLDDINKIKDKQKKLSQKKLQEKFQKTLKEQSEKFMRQQFADDNVKLNSNVIRQSQGIVNKYRALILQAISTRWSIPPETNRKLSCELIIKVAPGGVVLDVKINKSSGDVALDNSARDAVFKASPLPVPPDQANFEPFRQFVLKVKTENALNMAGG